MLVVKIAILDQPTYFPLNMKTIFDCFQLEDIDDELEEKDIELVKCSDRNIEKEYGFGFSPVLVHFHAEVPSIYRGDLEESNEILMWLIANLDKSEIEEVVD